jgi:hypothetical protein
METRTVQQAKVYYLIMNPVTDKAESGRIAMMSTSRQNLISAYENEQVAIYDDSNFRKVFKQGGPLEWYNPVWTFDGVDPFGHGLSEDWVDMENLPILQSKYYFV